VPDTECICPRFTRMWAAHQLAIVPLSQQTMASARRRLQAGSPDTPNYRSRRRVVAESPFKPLLKNVRGPSRVEAWASRVVPGATSGIGFVGGGTGNGSGGGLGGGLGAEVAQAQVKALEVAGSGPSLLVDAGSAPLRQEGGFEDQKG
jgi:hypothetical protein